MDTGTIASGRDKGPGVYQTVLSLPSSTVLNLSPEETKTSAGKGCHLNGLPRDRGICPEFSEAKCPSV